jgi:hypothetical protein
VRAPLLLAGLALVTLATGCNAIGSTTAPLDPSAGSAAGGRATEVSSSVDDAGPNEELDTALTDVGRLAPALESAVRGTDYPRTVSEAVAALDVAGLSTSAGMVVGGYRYDPDTVEFELCIEGPGGAFATYDTRPMSLRQSGRSGGCPSL